MTRRALLLALAGTAIVSAVSAGYVTHRLTRNAAPTIRAQPNVLASRLLGESRPYDVYLPEGYDSSVTARYPVLYVLDAEWEGAPTAEAAALLTRIGVIPPLIVIAISNVDDKARARDLTAPTAWRRADQAGGAARFLAFLESEMIPTIDSAYRTISPRMLAGWSRGGQFVLYSQIAAPSLFDGRFAHSPFVWSDEDDRAVREVEAGLAAAAADSSFLYVSQGEQETETMAPFRRLVALLQGQAPSSLRWRADVSAGADHSGNPRQSTPVALCAMFAASAQSYRPAR